MQEIALCENASSETMEYRRRKMSAFIHLNSFSFCALDKCAAAVRTHVKLFLIATFAMHFFQPFFFDVLGCAHAAEVSIDPPEWEIGE